MLLKVRSFIKEFIKSWQESIKLLIDKRFWLVTLKATKETYAELIKRFWWLIGACIVVDVVIRGHVFNDVVKQLLPNFFGYSSESVQNNLVQVLQVTLYIVWFLLWNLLAFVVFLIVRSSLEKKDYSYYMSYWSSYVWFVFVTAMVWVLRSFMTHKDGVQKFLWWFLSGADYLLFLEKFLELSTIYFSPFLVIYTFFYLDSKQSIISFSKRLYSALIMIFYTYPICLIVWFFTAMVAFLIMFFIVKIALISFGWLYFETNATTYHLLQILADDATKILIPFFFCLIHNLYIKQVHDHYERYAQ